MERIYLSQRQLFQHEHRLIAGGKETKEGRQTIFFTPLNPFGKDNEEEAVHGDLSVPRKFDYSSNWERDQDAVYWIKLSRAQDQGLRFWQTKSHAIKHVPVPPDCIFKVTAKKGERTLFERISPPRPAPEITLRSSWQVQQQYQQHPAPTCPRRLGASRVERDTQTSVKQEADSSRTEITTST